MVEAAVPDGGAFGSGAAGDAGAASVCGVSSAVSRGRDTEWDGDEGVFAGAVVCAGTGGVVGEWAGGDGAGGCTAI